MPSTSVVIAAAASTLLVGAAPAGAAEFAVTVQARQNTSWTQHTPVLDCAAGSDGAGSERVRIASHGPDRITVSANPLDPVRGVIRTRLTATRDGDLKMTDPAGSAACPVK